MKAELITRFHNISDDDTGIEMVIWKLPAPVSPSTHGYKYRLVYVKQGLRAVGFDNERGKGDHKHIGAQQFPYEFTDVDRLVDDFIKEVEKWQNEH
ncbi:MAG: hypothetical protein HZB71_06150 [Betaproteobacteria bacterium]|nr:hypothetical protein [Betaproteobacteria bacterium]